MESELVWRIDKIVSMIDRGMIGTPAMFASTLLHHSEGDKQAIGKLLSAIQPNKLHDIYDNLCGYPQSEYGWSLLPTNRAMFVKPDLGSQEMGDLTNLRCQEDRPVVEYLRALLLSKLREMESST